MFSIKPMRYYIFMIVTPVILLIIMGCGVAITQQSAQRAVSNAQVAVSDAKAARASQYSMEKMKRAERLLEDAEEALSRNRKQRAYTLAMNASKLARMAEQEANAQIADAGVSVKDYVSTPVPAKTQPATVEYKTVAPAIPQPAIVVPKKQEIAMPPARTAPSAASGYEMPPQQVPGIAPSSVMPAAASISISDAQSAIQALDEAQNAIDTARATIVRAKVEIGLAILKATVQQLSMSGGSTDMFNAVKAWYDYAQRAAEVGNYEEALRAIERAQSYAQSSGMPMR